jgi:hypothetical protein
MNMRHRYSRSFIGIAVVAAVVGGIVSVSVSRMAGQAVRPDRIDGRPNLSGIWQTNNEANWDLQAHAARPGMVTQQGIYPYAYTRVPAAPVVALGAVGAVPGSLGVVQGDGQIPYTPEARLRQQDNMDNWIDRDPEIRCYLPGIPRAMYMSHPYEITQSTNKIHLAFAFSSMARTIHMDDVELPPDYGWMGHSVGRWEGDTLVVDVTNFKDNGWFDRAGNHHSEALHLEERFTLITPNVINYEVTIEDPNVFTRPWRIAMPLYRRMESNMQLLEFRCAEFAEEFMYGHLRKEPLVRRWEGETMSIEVTRKIPEGEAFYDWYSR